jgi:hypothetical protein
VLLAFEFQVMVAIRVVDEISAMDLSPMLIIANHLPR